MNRLDFTELLDDVMRELTMPGGHFEARFGKEASMLRQAEFVAAVALTAADRYEARRTRQAFLLREADEHRSAVE